MGNKLSYQELARLSLAYHLAKEHSVWEKLYISINSMSYFYPQEAWFKEGRRLAEIVENSPLYKALNEE